MSAALKTKVWGIIMALLFCFAFLAIILYDRKVARQKSDEDRRGR